MGETPPNDRRSDRLKKAALCWPLFCAVVTPSVSYLSPRLSYLEGYIWLANGALAVAGWTFGSVLAKPGLERSAAAVGFAVWSVGMYFAASAILAVIRDPL